MDVHACANRSPSLFSPTLSSSNAPPPLCRRGGGALVPRHAERACAQGPHRRRVCALARPPAALAGQRRRRRGHVPLGHAGEWIRGGFWACRACWACRMTCVRKSSEGGCSGGQASAATCPPPPPVCPPFSLSRTLSASGRTSQWTTPSAASPSPTTRGTWRYECPPSSPRLLLLHLALFALAARVLAGHAARRATFKLPVAAARTALTVRRPSPLLSAHAARRWRGSRRLSMWRAWRRARPAWSACSCGSREPSCACCARERGQCYQQACGCNHWCLPLTAAAAGADTSCVLRSPSLSPPQSRGRGLEPSAHDAGQHGGARHRRGRLELRRHRVSVEGVTRQVPRVQQAGSLSRRSVSEAARCRRPSSCLACSL